ncbi:MAG: efflux RND transporter permease subunit [Lentimicrobiaceae bacterium]|nr:efflux RND transporter permease subunit [Lentimicrobiaceae bacterium]
MKLDNFIKRPVLSTVISIIIVLLGLIGLLTLPISQYPDIAPPTVEVKASYQGANAQTVVNSVIAPLEEEINGVEDMTYMTSTATNTGDATITVYFKPGSDPDMAAVNVQNRVTKAQGFLPSEVTKAGVTTSKKQSSILLAFTVYSENDKYDQEFLFNYLKINVIPQIKRIGGVGDAQLLGAEYSMRIWLKPDVMAQYGLIPSDVIAALNEQNIEAAPGQFGENAKDVTFQYMLKYKGRLVTPEEFGDIVIRANESGEVLRLRTVADVELGSLSYAIDTRSKGHEGITAMIYQSAGSNATQIINDIKALLEAEKRNFPPGVTYDILLDTNDFLFASIHEVIKTLLEAFVLVFLVVFIFLQNFRSTLIPAIAIPVALIGTFFMLKVMGFSINLLTLCALVLAIAIVVDDAIVVVEAVHEKLERGAKSARDASIEAMNEISGALISITLVMMAVFIPVSFMSGITGTFYRQFGLTMAISIAFSAINALTLSPALCALFLKPHVNHEGEKQGLLKRFFVAFNTAYDVTVKKYTKGVNFFIKNKLLSVGAVVAGVCLLFYLMGTTPTGLVPNEDTGTIFISLDMPPGTSLDKTKENMAKIEKLVAKTPAIRTYTSISGYSLLSAAQGSSYGSFICKLQDWEERDETESADAINRKLMLEARELVKDGRVITFSMPMISGYSLSDGFEFNLQDKTGGSIESFYAVTQEFLSKLSERPEIAQASTSFNPTYPQYMVEIDAAKCKQAGVSPSDILTTLQGYFGGIYASNFNRFGKLYRVMVQARPELRMDKESLNNIKIRNGKEMAPITQFINLERVYGPDLIKRFNLFTSILVNGSPAPGYSSGQAIQAIEETAEQFLPTGYAYEYSGMTREEQNQSGGLGMILMICIIFVYLLLSAQYESYILPLVVILSVPFGLAGTFIFARMMGIDNNIYLQIGLIMLIGLLAKNAILITEFAVTRRQGGMTIIEAAIDAAAARLRPILMTSLAMIIGLLPMMFAHGVGANGNSALGTGAIGGMLIGMICQIFIVPSLFVIFETIQEKFKPVDNEELGVRN